MMATRVGAPAQSRKSVWREQTRGRVDLRNCSCPLIFVLLLVLGWPSLVGASERLEISQVRQLQSGETRVRVYADLRNADGTAGGGLGVDDVAATIGPETAVVSGVRAFTDSQEGVGYVFLVDISLSIDEERFQQIREALDGWISRLRPQDRAALISFGSQSRMLVDWTNDFEALRSALAALGPADQDTLLYQGVIDALDLGERRDPDLPGRRVVVVLTDGRDEGSERALDDVLEEIRRRPLPIYAIGFSQLQGAQRVTYLDVLRRLASNSGGAFFEAERTQFAEAYERIAEAVHRVWVIDLDCPGCLPDGRVQRLQLSVRAGNRVLSRGADVRLLPQASLPARRSGATSAGAAIDPPSPSAGVGSGSGTPGEDRTAAEQRPGGPERRGADGTESSREGSTSAGSSTSSESDTPGAEGAAPTTAGDRVSDETVPGRGALLLWLGLIALMLGLIVVGLLARRAASSSEITAEMVRSELSRALGAKGGPDETPSSGAAAAERETSNSGEAAISAAAAAAAPTGASTSSSNLDKAAIEAAAAKAAAAAERARRREDLVERALLDHAQRRRTGQVQALFVPRTIRLVTVRGAQKGKQYRGIVRESLSVGARSTNDVVLVDEPTAPAELFEIFQDDYQIQLRPGDEQIVLCNGLPPEFGQELRSGDLVGTQDLIFRVVLDE